MSYVEQAAAAGVLDAVPSAVVLIDGDRRVAGWNTAAEVLYGRPRAKALGRPALHALFHPDDREAAEVIFDAAARGEPFEGDFRVRRRDGTLLVSSFRLVAAPAGTAMAWVATDQMDQRLAEQERSVLLSAEHAARATAEEALGLLEAILAAAPVGIAVFDMDMRYVRVNDAYAALTGLPVGADLRDQLGEVLPLEPDLAADLRRVVTTGRTLLGRPVQRPGADGDRYFTASFFPIRTATGAPVGAGLTLVEITETKRAEVERAALLRRAEAARQRLSILAAASAVLTTTMELDELLGRLTRVLAPAAADWCVIELVGKDGGIEHAAVGHRDRAAAEELARVLQSAPIDREGAGPVAEVLRTGQARLTDAEGMGAALAEAAKDRNRPELAGQFTLHTSVVVPVRTRSLVIGVLILATEGERSLDDDDLDLAVEIAHRAALAVQNAQAFQQEHKIAESLQRALLPATVPSAPGLELAVRYVAATDGVSVGGDWYDVLPFDDGTTGIVVGDVVGHDIAASTSMGHLRSALRAYAYEGHEAPAATLARVDRVFDSLELSYATCVFGVLDPSSGRFRWSNAGHPPPLLLRDGRVTFLDDGAGVLLGVSGGEGMEEAAIDLLEGDLLVLYTDGLVERRGESLQAGLARLSAVVATTPAADAGALCEALLEALVPSTASRDDDLAILVARVWSGGPAPLVHRLPFDVKPESAALARGYTAGVMEAAGWVDQVDTAVLLVSELVANAVRHAMGPCALVITIQEDGVELSVEDGDPRQPVARNAQPLDHTGRGLLLLSALAADWGVQPLPAGKSIWFCLPGPAARRSN